MRRVLVGFDGSEGAENALNKAMMIVDENGEIIILAVIPPPSESNLIDKKTHDMMKQKAKVLIDDVIKDIGEHEYEIKGMVEEGDIAGKIIRHIETLPPLTKLLSNGTSSEKLLDLLFQDIPFEILETQALSFRCSCSKGRTEQALIALGSKELTSMIQEQDQTEVVCEFCQAHYTFTPSELEQLLRKIH